MRMYLSSFRLGDATDQLVRLVKPPRRVAVIANASDPYPAAGRDEGAAREIAALRGLGLDARELDLRAYLDDRRALAGHLERYDALWVRGGNTFILRYLYARTGLDAILKDLLARDAIVYAGYSAGVVLLSATLRGLEIVDDPSVVEEIYGAEPIWDGVGVIPYFLVPHYESPGHPETEACGRLAEHYRRAAMPFKTLRDGQAIVIDGPVTTVVPSE